MPRGGQGQHGLLDQGDKTVLKSGEPQKKFKAKKDQY